MAATTSPPIGPADITVTVRVHGEHVVDVAVAWPGVRPFVSVAVRERDGLWLVHLFGRREPATPCYRCLPDRDAAVGLAVRLAAEDGRRLIGELASPTADVA